MHPVLDASAGEVGAVLGDGAAGDLERGITSAAEQSATGAAFRGIPSELAVADGGRRVLEDAHPAASATRRVVGDRRAGDLERGTTSAKDATAAQGGIVGHHAVDQGRGSGQADDQAATGFRLVARDHASAQYRRRLAV